MPFTKQKISRKNNPKCGWNNRASLLVWIQEHYSLFLKLLIASNNNIQLLHFFQVLFYFLRLTYSWVCLSQ